MAKRGRPLKEISADLFQGLCRIQCTLAEIASVLECSEDTVERWCVRTYRENFAAAYKKFSAPGKISLRRAQFKAAESGNTTMLVWLGKQYLGQRDQIDHKVEVTPSEAAKNALRAIMERHGLSEREAAPIVAAQFGVPETELVSEANN